MPELPDVTIYIECLERRLVGERLERLRVTSPFLLRTVSPSLENAEGKRVAGFRRLGKHIVFEMENGVFLVFHLMIAGRFRWKKAGSAVPRKGGLAALDFPDGTILMTEASTQKRASLHVIGSEEDLARFDRGGLEVLDATLEKFRDALARENHTVKRSLTDPRLFSGIGNAYSDEILHAAKLSPLKHTNRLDDEEVRRLHAATRETLAHWIETSRQEVGEGFPDRVTAFRDGMAVHGRFREPCPVCGDPVQRIVYARNECNYCATCQTGGKLYADRALSKLLRGDWPTTLDELEEMRGGS